LLQSVTGSFPVTQDGMFSQAVYGLITSWMSSSDTTEDTAYSKWYP
jgi:hypothetical protein